MTLGILDVVADPTLAFRSIGPAGEPLTAQVSSGHCRIGDTPDERFLDKLSGGRGTVQLGFSFPELDRFAPAICSRRGQR